MTSRPVHLVFTTIFVPHVLLELRANLERFGHLDQVQVWVVADHKTPAEAAALAQQANAAGLRTRFLSIAEQDEWGRRVPDFYARLPYNNETRRNIGTLCALEAGCQTLICIDDDNFPSDDDFLGGHLRTGSVWPGPVTSEPSGFYNVCEHLTFSPPRAIWPRGFPFERRGQTNAPLESVPNREVHIGANAGLWLREPDVDATTWLNGTIASTGMLGPETTLLDQQTWTPLNTQNTSVTRELIPAFLCVPMGYPVPGGTIERYGDIWGGYFLQSLLPNTPFHVAFGRPLVEHRRNPHRYLDDLRHEFWGLMLTDWLVQRLKTQFVPTTSPMCERVEELGELHVREELPVWAPEPVRDFLGETARNLRAWSAACRRFL